MSRTADPDKTAVVIITGWFASEILWEHVVSALPRSEFELRYIDPLEISLGSIASVVADISRSLGDYAESSNKIVLIGHSAGVLLLLKALTPSGIRPAKVILVSPIIEHPVGRAYEGSALGAIVRWLGASSRRSVAGVRVYQKVVGRVELALFLGAKLRLVGPSVPRSLMSRYFESVRERDPWSTVELMRALDQESARPEFEALGTSTVVLAGELDPLGAKDLEFSVPTKVRWVNVPGATHALVVEFPGLIADEILSS